MVHSFFSFALRTRKFRVKSLLLTFRNSNKGFWEAEKKALKAQLKAKKKLEKSKRK